MRLKLITIAMCIALSGCASIPDLTTHQQIKLDDQISSLVESSIARDNWWLIFNDTQFNTLVKNVLKSNQDIAVATLNIEKLGYATELQASYSQPQLDANASALREKLSATGFYPPPIGGSIVNFGQIGLKSSWNLDLFGKNSALVKSATHKKEAAELNKRALEFSLSVQTLKLYGYWQYLFMLENIQTQQLMAATKLLNMTKIKRSTGLAVDVDVLRDANQLKSVEYSILELKTNKQSVERELSKLTGSTTSIEKLEPVNLLIKTSALPPVDKVNSSQITQKPEIQYYLYMLMAQEAQLKAQRADFYPSITLTGELGFQKIGFAELLSKQSQFWTLGPVLNLPIFNAGRLQSNYKVAGVDLNTFIENYNKSVVTSFHDLNLELYKNKNSFESKKNINIQTQNNKNAFELATTRYDLGKISEYEQLAAKFSYLEAKKQELYAEFNYFNSHVDLINAAGGVINIKSGDSK